jgi:hypothetical protein
MRLSQLNLGYAPDATTFLNGVTLGAAPRPPPPMNPNANDGVASGAPGVRVSPGAGGACPAGTVPKLLIGGRKTCIKPNPKAGAGGGVKQPSPAPGSAPSPAPAVYSPNEDGSAPTELSPQGEGTGSVPWGKYALWGAYGVGGLVLILGAWKGIKYVKGRRAANRDEPL